MGANPRGRAGEEYAARVLREAGYQLLARNWHSRYGEIDLIMENDMYLVFVEVKLRRSDRYGTPAEYVTKSKQEKLRNTALMYLQSHHVDKQPRFDVVEIYAPRGMDTSPVPVHHIENAF